MTANEGKVGSSRGLAVPTGLQKDLQGLGLNGAQVGLNIGLFGNPLQLFRGLCLGVRLFQGANFKQNQPKRIHVGRETVVCVSS